MASDIGRPSGQKSLGSKKIFACRTELVRVGVYIREGVLTGTAGIIRGLAVAHGFGTSQYVVKAFTGTGRLALVLARTSVGASHHGQTNSSCPPAAKRLLKTNADIS